ncbi:retrovirus-related Pol polyprotein from transposon opus [Trichonephila clavipes]|nr:retrovirus-related Pol polyprotein from transposon opus [Trichonephila clavipes]
MEAIPIPEITAEIVGRAFYEKWICRFGVPAKIVTDQGPPHNNIRWTESLPTVLLGLRAAIRPDISYTIAQMVYGPVRGGNFGFLLTDRNAGREKDIFGSRAAIEFSLGEGERPAQRRSNRSIVFTATVSEGIAIFGSRAAIEFSFGEKERPAQRRSN